MVKQLGWPKYRAGYCIMLKKSRLACLHGSTDSEFDFVFQTYNVLKNRGLCVLPVVEISRVDLPLAVTGSAETN